MPTINQIWAGNCWVFRVWEVMEYSERMNTTCLQILLITYKKTTKLIPTT